MYEYSLRSEAKLLTCDPDLILIFTTVLLSVDHTIICGHRGQVAQTIAYESGKSKAQWPNSNHNSQPSKAVDAAPYFKELGGLDWKDSLAFACFAGRVLEVAARLYSEGRVSHRLRWGGDWNMNGRNRDQVFNDLAHFELVDY